MAAVADKIKSVVDFLVKGFEPRESFEDLADEMNEEVYEVQDNLAVESCIYISTKRRQNK